MRQIEQNGNPGTERVGGLELKAAHFHHVQRRGPRFGHLRAQRRAEIAAGRDVEAGFGQHSSRKRRRRRLPLRAGDRNDTAGEPSRGELDLANDRHADRPGGHERFLVERHTGAHDDEIRGGEPVRPVWTQLDLDPARAKLVGAVERLTRVAQDDLRALRDEQLRRGVAAPASPHDDDPFAMHVEGHGVT